MVVFLNIITYFICHFAYLQLYLLLTAQQLLSIALELPPASLGEVMEVVGHPFSDLAVRVVEPLAVAYQSQTVMPLDVI